MKNLCLNFDCNKLSIPPKPNSVFLVPPPPCRLWFPTWNRNKVNNQKTRKLSVSVSLKEQWLESAAKHAFGFGVSATFFFSIFCDSPSALAESLTVAFPVSRAPEVNAVQRTLVEAWGLIRETFVDPTYNHQDWDLKLQQTMVEMFPLNSADAAYTKIRGMLSTLGDPFTRIISPKEYQGFRIGSDGNLQGVGLFINIEPRTGHLVSDLQRTTLKICADCSELKSQVVLSCIEGSPAARAGIHQGDELVEINGIKQISDPHSFLFDEAIHVKMSELASILLRWERLDGLDSEAAAQRLRGNAGTTVTVKVKDSVKKSSIREVKLPRENIKLSPISSAIIPHRLPTGQFTKTGYVKLSAFSQTAAEDMKNAIQELENQGVHSYILDLRNNPGGLVKAGLDVAQMWLDGDETLVNTIDRNGNMLPITMVDGHAITHDPLVVIVNEGSASASEILAGALHDNGRAILVGHKTFGKGKIQSVTELHDGSALFVTVAKYLSPALHDIDQVGITPDIQCTTEMLNSAMEASAKNNNSNKKNSVSSLEADSCIMVAEHELDMKESKGTAS
ncbi:hypothetical protein Ahy_A02g007710 isoform A [Arachis hypogaea]|uniref:C-terminal processing peptidase n=1 Tax=Arachis hypogaea TaxID=3818 RepID=A0A445EDE5_ARAHY|nr:hypothetical protein Ahy_A02g007710 isoform A [Arachis hypogaea]